jgi:hypothetical protein
VIGLWLACSQEPAPSLDSGPSEESTLRPGQGTVAFEPLADGDVAWLYRGNQGLQHVWVSLRREGEVGFEPVWLALEVDGLSVSSPFEVSVPWSEREGSEVETLGLTLVVPDPGTVVGRLAVLQTAIGKEKAGVEVVVEWEQRS